MSYLRESKGLVFIFLVIFCCAPHVMGASSFVAHVDRTEIATGETITLTCEFSGRTTEEPDFSELRKDFTIVTRQTSNESTLINGDLRTKTSWILELLPKRSSKTLTIPSIRFGSQSSSPITLIQSEAKHKNVDDGIALSVSTDRDSVYVNAQLLLNIEMKTSLALRHGSLTKLEIPDAIIEPLNEDTLSEVIENGIKYHVFKKSYAIFPSKPGNLTIPSIGFSGFVPDNRGHGRLWPGFFSGRSKVSATSLEINVKVKDIPKEFPHDRPFLPVKSLLVIESFDEANPKLLVNKATIRRFEIKARGTLASFLPTIFVPRIQGLQVYSENGEKTTKGAEGDLLAISKVSHVYMPTSLGKVEIPHETIYWWDTETDKLKTTEIRALDLEIGGIEASYPGSLPSPSTNEPKNTFEEEVVKPIKNDGGSQKTLISLFVLIMLASAFIVWLYKKKQFTRLPTARRPRDEFKELIKSIAADCETFDGKRVYARMQELRKWAKQNSKFDIVSDALESSMHSLENALFDQRKNVDVNAALTEIKKEVLRIKLRNPAKKELAPLYPN